MLTWLDVGKLVIPITIPFAVLWARAVYLRRAERIRKQQTLWRSLDQETQNLRPTLRNLDELTDFVGYKAEFLRLFGFGIDGVDYAADVDVMPSIDGLITL